MQRVLKVQRVLVVQRVQKALDEVAPCPQDVTPYLELEMVELPSKYLERFLLMQMN